jgi:hypothetical protein
MPCYAIVGHVTPNRKACLCPPDMFLGSGVTFLGGCVAFPSIEWGPDEALLASTAPYGGVNPTITDAV